MRRLRQILYFEWRCNEMIQFTREEQAVLREKIKSRPDILEQLKKSCEPLFTYGLHIPHGTESTWIMDFECPEDSAKLIHNYGDPDHYECPICHRIYTGKPYSGAWWRYTIGVVEAGGYNAGLIYMLTGDEKYGQLCKDVLMGFAEAYPTYEEHGNIPYNNPGLMSSQTLCEALCIKPLAMCYDFVEDMLTEAEKKQVFEDMFAPSVACMRKYRKDILHNHEVVVDMAMGVIGILTGDEELLDFAVFQKYGLKDQLDRGVMADGFWFEATPHYHYFTLGNIIEFERVARGTKYSQINHPNFRRMLHMPPKIFQNDLIEPCLGDGYDRGHHISVLAPHYEYAYAMLKDHFSAVLLNKIYSMTERNNLMAFLYGAEIEETEDFVLEDYHDDCASGLTIMRGEKGEYLLFKHGSFGGEHDHYDKLAMQLTIGHADVIRDLGTVGYGAPPHYGYFKNTFTHNTVCIEGENQPPCNGRTIRFEKKDGITFVEAEADWTGNPPDLDSYYFRQWSDEAYKGVNMRRVFLNTPEYFVEAFLVRGTDGRTTDWLLHPQGPAALHPAEYREISLGSTEPISYMKNIRAFEREGIVKTQWQTDAGLLTVHSACSVPSTIIYADGPEIPMTKSLTYLIHRVNTKEEAVYVNLFSVEQGESQIENVQMDVCGHAVHVKFTMNGIEREHSFTIGE